MIEIKLMTGVLFTYRYILYIELMEVDRLIRFDVEYSIGGPRYILDLIKFFLTFKRNAHAMIVFLKKQEKFKIQ
jgi:hypothetical protein